MINNPFGPSVVELGGLYLGAWLVAVANEALATARRWAPAQTRFLLTELWRNIVEKRWRGAPRRC
eukprot:2559211-Lingulodinium_polyedra.AAC.1